MSVGVLFLVPLISLAVDYTSWIEACFIKGAANGSERWEAPISSYFRTDGMLIRNGLLSGALLFAWLWSRSDSADAIAAAAVFAILFIAHVAFAIWSFHHNLTDYYRDHE